MFYGNFKNPDDRDFILSALQRFAAIFHSVFAADNMILFERNLAILNDKKFSQACEQNARNDQERSLVLRLNTLTWAASEALRIPGDFVECGVWRGFCSAVIADYLDFTHVPKTFYLYDTFDGIPSQYDSEKHDAPDYHEAGLYQSVVDRFARFSNVEVVRGIVPDSFAQAAPERIAFLHLDMNSSTSEIAALEVLFERVSSWRLHCVRRLWLGRLCRAAGRGGRVHARARPSYPGAADRAGPAHQALSTCLVRWFR